MLAESWSIINILYLGLNTNKLSEVKIRDGLSVFKVKHKEPYNVCI